jgi:hypothetical protein
MALIDDICAIYDQTCDRHIDVPEWSINGVPLRIYWKELTIGRRKKIFARPDRTDVDVLIEMACDEHGKKLFSPDDRVRLREHASAAVITRIAGEMLGISSITQEIIADAEKN